MPFILSELHFYQVRRELFLGDTMKFNDSLFGIAPESLKAVNVYFSGRESFLMVDSQMTISTKHKGIITSKFIGIDDRSTEFGLSRMYEMLSEGRIKSLIKAFRDINGAIEWVSL